MASKSEEKRTAFTNAQGKTTHECSVCHKHFLGTQKRGRPFTKCPEHRKA